MPDTISEIDLNRAASVARARKSVGQPLLGITILLVEDSRYFADAVRLLSIRSGARIRRADCLASARKHVKLYRPDIVIVDLGLPDGSGLEFVAELKSTVEPPSVIAISGVTMQDAKLEAMEAGADSFLEKPFFDLASFQQNALSVLAHDDDDPQFVPRLAGCSVQPDEDALQEDLSQIAEILKDATQSKSLDGMDYVAAFLRSVSRVSKDLELNNCARALSKKIHGKDDWQSAAQVLTNLVQLRIDEHPATPI